MRGISDSALAAAVSNAGGLGQIATSHLEDVELIRQEIRRTKELTDKPIGVNLAIGRRPQHQTVDVVLEEGVGIVSVSGGNPSLTWPGRKKPESRRSASSAAGSTLRTPNGSAPTA